MTSAVPEGASAPGPRRGLRVRLILPALPRKAAWGVPLLAGGLALAAGSGITHRPFGVPASAAAPGGALQAEPPASLAPLRARQRELRRSLERLAPRGLYLVIDRTNNRVFLRRGGRVIREMVCSAGSGWVLQEREGKQRRWIFDTPRGGYRVLSKIERPVWKKPDWAFVEEGEPIPERDAERFEYGVLGEYGLYFGDGYLIHGTLYERLLGRNVTHGCIRLGREDLSELYRSVPLGTPIFIY